MYKRQALLSQEQKVTNEKAYTDLLTQGEAATTQRLNEITARVEKEHADLGQVLKSALDGAAATMQAAADTQLAAAQTALQVNVTHSLNNQDVHVQVREVATHNLVECDVQNNGVNTVVLAFSVAPASNALRVVVQG